MKILMLSSTFPYPPTKGGTHNRTFNLLQPLARQHEVTLITQRSPDVTDAEVEGLGQVVANLVVFPRPHETKSSLWSKLTNFSEFLTKGTPPNVLYLYSEEIQDWVDDAVANRRFDAITCEHSVNEVYIRPQWRNQVKTIINIHSSLYRTCRNQLETGTSEHKWRDRVFLPLLRRYEQRYLSKFTQIVVTTDEDQSQMRAFNPQAQVIVIPNGVDLDTFPYRPQDPGGHHLVFVGGLDYFVNIDAACCLAKEIFPLIQAKYGDATLTLVGANPSAEVRALTTNPAIKVTGRVPSVAAYLHQATVFVAPLRTGFGMKIKTLEAMASGIPVVGSDRALEGLEVYSPCCALRANTVTEFVEAISRLLENNRLRDELSRNGRYLIEQKYTWKSAAQLYAQIIDT